jgi:hypothetical protein
MNEADAMKSLKIIDKVYYQTTFRIIFSVVLIFIATVTSQAGVFSPQLQSTLQNIAPDHEISVIVTLSDRADISQFKQKDKKLRRGLIIRALRQKAEQTQTPIRAFLENNRAKRIIKLWVINGIAVKAKANVIQKLATLPGIESIKLDAVIQAPVTTLGSHAPAEWNIESIRAPELWGMGYTGQGIVFANMDTGVDKDHPDIGSKWRGGTNSWYDPNGEHPDNPFDRDGHGTQSMGLMVGGDAGGTSIGVAYGAQWIAVKIFNDAGTASYGAIHQGYQWLLDPDGNSDTNDVPDIVNNSWGFDNINNCDYEFQVDIQALKAAGIAVVFAAGNSGPGQSSISPQNNPEGYSTGAIDQSNNIASFSSRGPSACDGSIYPEVVAPGVDVRTADLTFGGAFPDSYTSVSGTSFASPHVAGAMALLLDAFPDITVAELEFALEQSALDLGAAGPDNDYGYGLIDVVEAYNLISVNNNSINVVTARDVNGNGSEDIAVLCIDSFTGSKDVYVKDGSDGTLIRKVNFNVNYSPYDLVAIQDMNSNGSSELGVLGVHIDTGKVRVQIKDALTGGTIKSIYFSKDYAPQQVEVIPDTDNNGAPELGVLGVNVNTGAIRVQIKDTLTKNIIKNVSFSKNYTPRQFVVLPDINSSGAPELGVLGVNVNTGKVRVQIKDALTGSNVKNVSFSKDYAPYQVEVIPDINSSGAPELGVLGVNVNTGAVRVQIKDASAGNNVKNVNFSIDYTSYQFAVIHDTDGNGASDIGVLGVSVNTGKVRVQIKDALTGVKLQNIFFDEDYTPKEMVVVDDIDGNNISELAVLGKDRITGNVQAQIKDSLSSAMIATIPIP